MGWWARDVMPPEALPRGTLSDCLRGQGRSLELSHDHAPASLTITERNLAEEIDQVVTRTLAWAWDNADARNRGARRATAAVFRRYARKPVGEPYDSTVAYIEAHYLVD